MYVFLFILFTCELIYYEVLVLLSILPYLILLFCILTIFTLIK